MRIKKAILAVNLLLLIVVLNSIDTKFIRVIYESKIPIANNIQVFDQYIYVNNDWYLYVYNFSNIWSPYIETAFNSSYPITDVLLLDHNKIYICSHEPTNEITEIDSLNRFGRIFQSHRLISNKARREGVILYTTSVEHGLEIFDLGQGLLPQKLSSYSEKWGFKNFEVRYPTIHALNDFGYVYLDITDLKMPKNLGTNYEFIDGSVITVNRNIAWIGAGNNLIAIEFTYPDKPTIINRYRLASDITTIKAKGNELFVGLKTSGLRILDITNPKNIIEKNSFYIKTGVNSIALDDEYLYLGAGNQGWLVLEYK